MITATLHYATEGGNCQRSLVNGSQQDRTHPRSYTPKATEQRADSESMILEDPCATPQPKGLGITPDSGEDLPLSFLVINSSSTVSQND